MVYLHSRIKSSEFFRNLLTLMTGSGLAAFITVISAPLVTRLYTPEDFGVFALFISITSVVGAIACFRYDVAIVLPRYNYQAVQLASLSIALCVFVSLVMVVFFTVGSKYISAFLTNQKLNFFILDSSCRFYGWH